MTHTMACAAADVFAAAGPVSFTLSGGNTTPEIIANCRPSLPIAVIEFHGTADTVVPFDTGVLDGIGAQASLNAWIQVQQCSATATRPRLTTNTTCELHAGCGGTANQVGLCTVQGGVHVLYPSVAAPGIASFLYDFFQAQPSR
jgi:polyhydroxybutyrate depolymerase